jgi:hypothetical protein
MDKLNPIQQHIAEGMNPLVAFLTEATCGDACWHAVEDVCRCSCGGKNHGCLRTAEGVRPVRTSKIDGFRYELKAVGPEVWMEARTINKAAGPRGTDGLGPYAYAYPWEYTDKGAPARLKRATKAQLASWPELAGAREAIANLPERHCFRDVDKLWPSLLWVKV